MSYTKKQFAIFENNLRNKVKVTPKDRQEWIVGYMEANRKPSFFVTEDKEPRASKLMDLYEKMFGLKIDGFWRDIKGLEKAGKVVVTAIPDGRWKGFKYELN